jgi:hypothetical protein
MITQCKRGVDTEAEWSTLHATRPLGPSASQSAIKSILNHSVQNHPKPVSFLSSGVSSGSGLMTLNPTIDHTYIYIYLYRHIYLYRYICTVDTSGVNRLASQICHNRLFRKKLQHNLLRMISTEVLSLATPYRTIQQPFCKVRPSFVTFLSCRRLTLSAAMWFGV